MLFRQKSVPHETPEQIAEALRRGDVVLIDVREPAEYAHERIEGAILYPLSRFDAHFLGHYGGLIATLDTIKSLTDFYRAKYENRSSAELSADEVKELRGHLSYAVIASGYMLEKLLEVYRDERIPVRSNIEVGTAPVEPQ